MGGSSGQSTKTSEVQYPPWLEEYIPQALQSYVNVMGGQPPQGQQGATQAQGGGQAQGRQQASVPPQGCEHLGNLTAEQRAACFGGRTPGPGGGQAQGGGQQAGGMNLGGTPEFFPGATVAPMSERQRAAISQSTDVAQLANELSQRQQALGGGQADALNYSLSGKTLDVGNNPHVQGMLKANAQPIMQQLMEQYLPQIRGDFVSGGGRGGSREAIATGQAFGGAANAIANSGANILGNAYSQGLENYTRALGLSPSVIQSQALPFGTASAGMDLLGRAGQQEQAQAQREITGDRERHDFNQNRYQNALKDFMGILYGHPAGSRVTVEGGNTNPFNAALGGGVSGGTAGAMTGNPLYAAGGAALGAGAGLLGSLF